MKRMHPVNRAKKILREAEQVVRDVEYWNRVRTDAVPMDCEDVRLIAAAARKYIDAFERGDRVAADKHSAELARIGEQVVRDTEGA